MGEKINKAAAVITLSAILLPALAAPAYAAFASTDSNNISYIRYGLGYTSTTSSGTDTLKNALGFNNAFSLKSALGFTSSSFSLKYYLENIKSDIPSKASVTGIAGDTAKIFTKLDGWDSYIRDSSSIKSNTSDIDSKLKDIKGYVDGIEGYIDNVEALLTDIKNKSSSGGSCAFTSSDVTALKGYVDNLEAYTDGLEGLIAGIQNQFGYSTSSYSTITLKSQIEDLRCYVDDLESYVDDVPNIAKYSKNSQQYLLHINNQLTQDQYRGYASAYIDPWASVSSTSTYNVNHNSFLGVLANLNYFQTKSLVRLSDVLADPQDKEIKDATSEAKQDITDQFLKSDSDTSFKDSDRAGAASLSGLGKSLFDTGVSSSAIVEATNTAFSEGLIWFTQDNMDLINGESSEPESSEPEVSLASDGLGPRVVRYYSAAPGYSSSTSSSTSVSSSGGSAASDPEYTAFVSSDRNRLLNWLGGH